MKSYSDINKALADYVTAFDKLQKLGVTPNKKDFTSQIGEWFVSELYGGQRAASSTQKDWDIQVNDKNIQSGHREQHYLGDRATVKHFAVFHLRYVIYLTAKKFVCSPSLCGAFSNRSLPTLQ